MSWLGVTRGDDVDRRRARPERALRPADHGRPMADDSRLVKIQAEKEDSRRMNTDYVRALRREIQRRAKTGELYEGIERRGIRVEDRGCVKAQGKTDGQKKAGPIDTVDGRCFNVFLGDIHPDDGSRSRDDVDQEEMTMATATLSRSWSAKVKKAKATKEHKKAKKQPPRSKRKDVPCCINYPRALLGRIDKAARKVKQSRSEFIRDVLARRVGFKAAG